MPLDSSVAELIVKIVADSTEVRKALEEASTSQKKFAKDTEKTTDQIESDTTSAMARVEDVSEKTTKSLSRNIQGLRMLGFGMRMLGAMMSGPIIAALAVTAKSGGIVGWEMRKLSNTMRGFSDELAKAAVPTVRKFNEWMEKLSKWFKDLPQSTKESAVNIGLVGGSILLVSSTIIRLLPLLTRLTAFGKIPIVAAVLGLGVPAVAGVAAGVGLASVVENNRKAIELFLLRTQDRIKDFWEWLKRGGKEAGPAMEFGWGGVGPGTSWPEKGAVDLGKISVGKKGKPEPVPKKAESPFLASFKLGLDDAAKKFGEWGNKVQTMTVQFADNMANTFSSVFFDAFTGKLRSAKEYFAEFGKSILQMFSQVIAQLITYWIITATMKAMGIPIPPIWGGASKHTGGAVKHFGGFIKRAHDGLSAGEVPIIAQSGEGILSRNGMATLGGVGNLNSLNAGEGIGRGPMIYLTQVIRAWGPEDVYRERKMLASAMIDELEKQGPFRSAIRRYGK